MARDLTVESVGSEHFVLAWQHNLTEGIQEVFFNVSLQTIMCQLRQTTITLWGENVTTVNNLG